MPEQTILKYTMPKTKPRCQTCNGNFGLIRHRHASKQFCSKQCLASYLAKTKQQASSFKAWTTFLETNAKVIPQQAIEPDYSRRDAAHPSGERQ